ncbi:MULTISPECIES: hypothetical protein [unclassified Erwinia]|uniref:hypothetical protein n=1 Tax=unclassified Erwinia TaxID=2622719 RepID=UPI00092F5DEE|nr:MULTISPECIES: hypothetical protein [unclassified Erwinia]
MSPIARITRYLLLTIASPLLLSGCLFHDYSTPHVDGTLANGGKPIVGAAVTLTDFCKPIATSQTDTSGHFSLTPDGHWQLFIPVGPQDRLIRWAVVVDSSEGELQLYSSQRFGGVFSGYSGSDRLTLACDIAGAEVGKPLPETMAYCTPVTDKSEARR